MKQIVHRIAAVSRASWMVALLAVAPVFPAYAGPVPANLGNGLEAIYRDHLAQQGALPASSQRAGGADAAAAYLANAVQDTSGRLNVMIHLNGDVPLQSVVDALGASRKFEVSGRSAKYRNGAIEGWLSIQDVASVAKIRGISSVILNSKPVTNVGATTQKGVIQHRVDKVSQDGTGITVAALSDSYDVSTATIKAANDIASGDLPGVGNPAGNTTPVVIVQESSTALGGGADEGRAMLQLIHDMAPKARLGFATANGGQLNFADNIRSLAALPGAPRTVAGFKADIIVDDIIYLAEPMFSDGIVAQAVNDVNAAGVHYFSSAGNRPSTNAYASDVRIIAANDSPTAGTNINLTGVDPALYAGGFHNFRTDGTRDIAQTLQRTTGTGAATARLVLQWDDPFDKVEPGTRVFTQSANFTGTPATLDYTVPLTAGVPTRVTVVAASGSAFDAIVTVTDPSGTVVINALDTGTDETVYFTPTASGNYKITIAAFGATTGNFTVEAFINSSVGVTSDFNILFFHPTTGAFISAVAFNNLQTNQGVEVAGSIPIPTGLSSLQMVIARANTPKGTAASRLRYVIFDGNASVIPAEYFSYQYPTTYGHSTAKDAHGVAAYSAFRPYVPEGFSSPGPSTILFDAAGNRLASPEVRQKPDVAGMDGGNTTFFVSDSPSDADTFPNFFGTSAAAPNAAAIAALVLQAYGGPGSLSVKQMKSILQRSAYPHDLDPYFSQAVINTGSGVLTLTVNADQSGTSSSFAFGALDPKVISVSYSGTGTIASLSINLQGGNTTGGNENAAIPGLAFDTRAAASGGLPFTLGVLNGLTAADITPAFSVQPPSPSLAGQYYNLDLTFAAGSFGGGKSFTFNVDRDEQTVSNLTTPSTAGGNSADFWGANVTLPGGVVAPGGVTVSGTMADGTPFSGVFINNIGAGYSPLDGYGFINAQVAVNTGPRNALDLSADGRADILYRESDGSINGLLMNGATPFAGGTILTPASGWTVTQVADADGDGRADLIIRNTDGRAALLVMNGLNVTSYTTLLEPGTGWTVTHAADLDGNGKADLVLKNTDGRVAVLLLNGTATPSYFQLTDPGSPYTPTHVGDFNGDGKADIVLKHTDGSAAILLMNGATVSSASFLLNAGSPWSVSHVADLNGDGKADAIIKNTDGSAALLRMDGTTVVEAAFLLLAGSPWSVTHTGDFDGDGKADLLIKNTDGSVALLQMNGTAVSAATFLLLAGSTTTVAQVADYNGDGKSDILLKNANGSTTAILMNGGTVTAVGSVFGAGSKQVVP